MSNNKIDFWGFLLLGNIIVSGHPNIVDFILAGLCVAMSFYIIYKD
jgi:hypothetical protein